MGMKKQYKSGTVRIVVDYGYDIHDIEFSGRTYNQIMSGKPVVIRGQGFFNEEQTVQDRWEFNLPYPNLEPVMGSLRVYCDDSRELYVGQQIMVNVHIKGIIT
jgi:hypothetical protein